MNIKVVTASALKNFNQDKPLSVDTVMSMGRYKRITFQFHFVTLWDTSNHQRLVMKWQKLT